MKRPGWRAVSIMLSIESRCAARRLVMLYPSSTPPDRKLLLGSELQVWHGRSDTALPPSRTFRGAKCRRHGDAAGLENLAHGSFGFRPDHVPLAVDTHLDFLQPVQV